MANYDFMQVKCDNEQVIDYIKSPDVAWGEINEQSKNEITFRWKSGKGHEAIIAASLKYPDSIITVETSFEAEWDTRRYFMTFKNGEYTLNDVKIQYMWQCNNLSNNENDEAITTALESFFKKIDTVTMGPDSKYCIDENEDKEITVVMQIDEKYKVKAMKKGFEIELQNIWEKKMVESWEPVEKKSGGFFDAALEASMPF